MNTQKGVLIIALRILDYKVWSLLRFDRLAVLFSTVFLYKNWGYQDCLFATIINFGSIIK